MTKTEVCLMKEIASRLLETIERYKTQLTDLPAGSLDLSPAPGKWSGKEILGHLIDSAQTNIRRMVVAQYEDQPMITYRQNEWVSASGYAHRHLEELIELWYLLNRNMAAVLNEMDEDTGNRVCLTPEPHSIRWLADDYIKHMLHHLHQALKLEEIEY